MDISDKDRLLLTIIHLFADRFEDEAVIKGGMALRLFDSPRATNDVDYVFVPHESKKSLLPELQQALDEIPNAVVRITAHSTMVRADVTVGATRVQVEVSVAMSCPSQPQSTGGFAVAAGEPPRIVRIMDPPIALAHKLAAWNERRLERDLYDAYFLSSRVGATIDENTLQSRLEHMRSRLPQLRRKKSMSLEEFVVALRNAAQSLDQQSIASTLEGLLPTTEVVGLAGRMRASLLALCDQLPSDHEA